MSAVRCRVVASLYYDEDGDLAHEFYEEAVVTKNGRKKSKLKRIQKNLIPQTEQRRKNDGERKTHDMVMSENDPQPTIQLKQLYVTLMEHGDMFGSAARAICTSNYGSYSVIMYLWHR
ncbi:hypothetical protein F2P81_012570 [Scophthalmus maximus]|uniref:Tumor suppressor candidate 2 n=1 Tax=Scophthalmus maximus TaxID=52904 RepID=A0A6A4SXQ9_SCOMX|nr:hypothetical protein F2P81_012570 [Scophthalmus maximus]